MALLLPCSCAQERVQELQDTLEASQRQAASLQNQISAMQAAQHSLQSSLEGKQAAEAGLATQLAQVRGKPGAVAAAGRPPISSVPAGA